MDPVSLAGLLASIDTLADRAFKLVSLINTIKEGGKQRLSLFTELNALWMVLKLLEGNFQSDDEELSDPWLETIAVLDEEHGVFDQISTAFESLDKRLRPKSGHRKIMQTLRWPFDKPEVEHLVHQLQRLKSYVDSAMNSTSAADIRKIQSDTKAIKLSVADDELKTILEWISKLNFLKQQNEIIEQTRQGTGQWFLQKKTFLLWQSEVEAMLWSPGIPGAGKTFLASIVFEHLKKAHEGQNVAVLIVYCGYNDTKSQSINNLVAALIKQVLQSRAEISKELRELHRQHSRTELFPSLEPLTKVLRSELAKFDKTYIIVDGLDEILDESNRLLLLETLTHGKVNIMVTSRPLETIQDLFAPIKDISCDGCEKKNLQLIYHCKQCLGRGFDLCDECHGQNMTCAQDDHYQVTRFGSYQIDIGATEGDVRLYVKARIGHEPRLLENVTKKRTLREEIASTIVQQSNGMFLLARLHIDAIATKRTPKAVQEALQSLPTKIGATYDQAMQRIEQANEDDRQIAMKFLQWITFAVRPLTVPEVEHACAIDAQARDIDPDEVLRASDMTSICAGLVIIDASEIVRLVHFSAQNYFQENRQRWFPEGNISLAHDCLSYLSFKAFDSGPLSGPTERDDFETRSSEYPLLEYCSSYWGLHAASADQPQELTRRILVFLNNSGHLNSAIQALWYSNSPDVAGWDVKIGVLPLHLAAYFGLTRVASRLLSAEAATDSRDSQGATPLMYAAAGGNAPVVQELLREGADPNLVCNRGSSSLHRAIAFGKVKAARVLLDHPNIDINLVDRSRRDQTALMLASSFGQGQIVPILVHKPGLDVNSQSGESQSTALHCAAELGDAQIVRLILDHPEVDVNKRDRICTPLTLAARNGHLSVVEALLDHGADTELQEGVDRGSGTPLNRAIDYGYIRIVRLLLERGANPTVLDILKRTIVHSAAVNGQDEILRVLFEFPTGVDINAQGTNGRTAMHDAAYFNYCSTIEILFENGARTDIHDGAGRSPLGVAKDMNNLEALELLTKLRKEEAARDESIGPLKHTDSSIDDNEIGLLKATKLGMTDTVRSYIARALSDSSIELNISDLDQHTALHLAVSYHHVNILDLLIGAGADMNAIDRLKRTPLHYTALHGDHNAAERLLEAGASVYLEDHFGQTVLDISLNYGNSELVVLLLEHGAWPKTTRLQASLFAAAMYGSAEMVEKLVDAGADPLKKETSGKSPYHFAEYMGNKETAEMILSLCERRGQSGKSSKAAT